MRYSFLTFAFLFGMGLLNPIGELHGGEAAPYKSVDKADAVQAMATANEWRWSQKDIKSYVNSQEVVFKFSDGRTKKIPLPRDKMVVAVAPYIRQTHT